MSLLQVVTKYNSCTMTIIEWPCLSIMSPRYPENEALWRLTKRIKYIFAPNPFTRICQCQSVFVTVLLSWYRGITYCSETTDLLGRHVFAAKRKFGVTEMYYNSKTTRKDFFNFMKLRY